MIKLIYLIHVLYVAPLLLYSGYIGRNLAKKEEEALGAAAGGDEDIFNDELVFNI